MTVLRRFVLVTVSLVLLVWGIYAPPFTSACQECGKECVKACGTKAFRSCCMNYMKKRSAAPGTEMKLELMMLLPQHSGLRSHEPHQLQENEYKVLQKLQADEFDQVNFSEFK